jgi:hypothetical protein
MQKFSIYLIIAAILAGIIFILVPSAINNFKDRSSCISTYSEVHKNIKNKNIVKEKERKWKRQ